MVVLRVGDAYSRKDVHDVFDPDRTFNPQTGSWGLHGMIRIPGRPGDWVFFVTFGQRQGEHTFDESVTSEGVLTWQSQPRLGRHSPAIRELIAHDETVNTIYLFLRTQRTGPYTYLGRLAYLRHDDDREHPVWFQWQILNWPPPGSVLEELDLMPFPGWSPPPPVATGELTEVPRPSGPLRRADSTARFRSSKAPDYAEADGRNRELGLAGELLVLRTEHEKLEAAGRGDLADRIRHVSVHEGDGAGYDIHSFTGEGEHLRIEVKTTRGPAQTGFYLTPNEIRFAQQHPSEYRLYRLFEYDAAADSARYFVLTSLEGLDLMPTAYRAILPAVTSYPHP